MKLLSFYSSFYAALSLFSHSIIYRDELFNGLWDYIRNHCPLQLQPQCVSISLNILRPNAVIFSQQYTASFIRGPPPFLIKLLDLICMCVFNRNFCKWHLIDNTFTMKSILLRFFVQSICIMTWCQSDTIGYICAMMLSVNLPSKATLSSCILCNIGTQGLNLILLYYIMRRLPRDCNVSPNATIKINILSAWKLF